MAVTSITTLAGLRDRIRLLAGIEQEELDNDTLDILISISTEWFTEQTGLTYDATDPMDNDAAYDNAVAYYTLLFSIYRTKWYGYRKNTSW